MNKEKELFELAKKRQKTKYKDYKNIWEFPQIGDWSNFVSPYTKSANNFDSNIMVMLQDWSSEDTLGKSKDKDIDDMIKCGYTQRFPTNMKLIELLGKHFDVKLNKIYATNLFPFIKKGGSSSRIPQKDLIFAAKEFGLPQIKIINPKIVICLGLPTFNALRKAKDSKLVNCYRLDDAFEQRFEYNQSTIFCQAHTGSWGQKIRKKDRVKEDWLMMVKEYNKLISENPANEF